MPRATRTPNSPAAHSAQLTRTGPIGRARGKAGESEQLSDTIATIYDAAIDRERWVDAVGRITPFVGCFAGTLAAVDLLHGGLNLVIQWGYPQDGWQKYLEHFYHRNPLNGPTFRTQAGDVVQASTLDAFDEFLRSELYIKLGKPLGLVDAIQATIDKTASSIAVLTCVRHVDAGPVGQDDLRRMTLILPHLRRALSVAQLLDLHTVRADAFAEAVDGLSTGVFFISAGGHLIHANAAGQTMIDAGDPVMLSGGHLVTRDHAMLTAIRQAYAAALDETVVVATPSVSVGLMGRDDRPFTAHVLPLTSGTRKRAAASISAAAVVFVQEAAVDISAAIGAASQLYSFTPAETRVLTALVEVGGAAAILGMLGVAKRTVQTHLEHLFEKTGTKRQAELVRLIVGYTSPVRGRWP
jgi:DNA-binding CsgD family transcriptional regulator